MQKLTIAFLFLALLGCTSRSSSVINSYLPNLVDNRPAIIFIHGYYGAALRNNLGKRVFLTGTELFFGSGAMSLFHGELGTPRGPELEVEGLLGTVPVIPGLYEVDVYSSFIKTLRASQDKSQILPLVYDWRDDLTHAVQKLDTLVKLLQEKGTPSISIVSHSMGGLVSVYYLGYGNQPPESAKLNWEGAKNIRRALFFGTPFGGSMVAFRSFEKGSGIPRSDRLLSADTMSSYPSLYQLIPTMATVLDKSGNASSLPLFEAETWKKFRFGLLRKKDLPPNILSAREKFTEEQVAKARRWSDLVQLGKTTAWPSPESLKVMNVVGSTRETLDLAYFAPESGKLIFDPDEVKAAGLKMDSLYKGGDGTVSRSSADVPAALEAATKVVNSDFSHDKLFLDPSVESEYNDFLKPETR